ncbi:septum formation family protein [Streptomyces sp. PmtG]
MATPRQGHQGDPYAPDPGEFQIPYSWVPEPAASARRGQGPPGSGDTAARRRRRRARRGALAVVVTLALGTAAAAAISRDALPGDWLPAWGAGPVPDRSRQSGTDTALAADTASRSPTEPESGTATEPGTETATDAETGGDTDLPETDPPTGLPSGTPVSWDALRVGDCVAGREARLTALRVDCDEAHHFELFAVAPRYPAAAYPGAAVLQSYAQRRCAERFAEFAESYLGTDDLTWTAGTVTPASWRAGRPVACYVLDRARDVLYGSALTDAPGFGTGF